MAVLKNTEYKTAVWGAKNNFITGLDPLGLQNTSEATYTHLLPGITNLTNRIRYYGFYCWLLEYYAKHIRHTDPKEQSRFIRRAELMLALLMKSRNPDYTQVTGSLFAGNMIDAQNGIFFNLKDNADQEEGRKTYWKFSSGAFGQYYAGAMREIGLILRNDKGNFICSNKDCHSRINGVMLAEAFEENVAVEARELFIQNILEGQLLIGQIDLLHEQFALNHIELESSEWNMYTQLLLEEDHPALDIQEEEQQSFKRKETLKYLIGFIGQEKVFQGADTFPTEIYLAKGTDEGSTVETLRLWYFYHLNELWHFGAGATFWGMLHMLDTAYNQIHLPLFVRNYAEQIQNYLEEHYSVYPTTTIREALSFIQIDETQQPSVIRQAVRTGDHQVAGGNGMALILSIYQTNHEELEPLQHLAFSKSIIRDGNVLDFFEQLERYLDSAISDFVYDFILRNLIYRHQYVALRKTGNGTQSTLKFLLEENYIRHIESFGPRFTSPRLGALYHILQDLQLVSVSGELTEAGKEFYKSKF